MYTNIKEVLMTLTFALTDATQPSLELFVMLGSQRLQCYSR